MQRWSNAGATFTTGCKAAWAKLSRTHAVNRGFERLQPVIERIGIDD
jgi:hypothetical protein